MDLRKLQEKQITRAKENAFRSRLRGSRSTYVYERPYAKTKLDEEAAKVPTVPSQTTALTVAQLSRKMAGSKIVIRAARTAKERPDLPRQHRSRVLQRHAVKKSAKKYHKTYRRPLKPMLVSMFAVAFLVCGVYAVFASVRMDKMVKAQSKVLAAKSPTDEGITDGAVSEEEPKTSIDNYVVPADQPRVLTIDKLAIASRVRRVGASSSRSLKSPANIFDAGWYEGSSKPGEAGAVVVNGHVFGTTKNGIFYGLSTMKTGDKISIERGDGKRFTYSVTGMQRYDNDQVDMGKLMTTSVPGKPALNLITCTGRFNVRTNQFEQRIVVFAVQDS